MSITPLVKVVCISKHTKFDLLEKYRVVLTAFESARMKMKGL